MNVANTPNQSSAKLAETTRKLRVCHVVCTSDGGTWMFEQLRELRDRYGYEVMAVVSGERGRLIDKLHSENIPYHVARLANGTATPRAILQLPLAVLKLAWFFRRERFDVVQSHVFATAVTVRPAAWLADVPLRAAMIAGPFHLQAYTSRWIERATCWMETKLIPSCDESLDLCREMGISEKRLANVIYYSPDEKNFDPAQVTPANIRAEFGWSQDTPIVCMVAYFYHRMMKSSWVPDRLEGRGLKGHEDFIKAARIVMAEFPEAKFLLVGSAWDPPGQEFLEDMKEMVRSMGLESSVIFTGYRADANRILSEANVAVQASLNENLGGTIEALMLACPLVATRVGGMVDTVRDGLTGILVNPAEPKDLARGIVELLRDPEKGRSLGRAGRKLMLERFTLRRTVDDLAHLYQSLLSTATKRREFYDPFISFTRLVASFPVFLYLLSRLTVFDLYLPIYLPAYLARARVVPIRFYYFARYPLIRLYFSVRNLLIRIYFFIRCLPARFLGKCYRMLRDARVKTAPLSPTGTLADSQIGESAEPGSD